MSANYLPMRVAALALACAFMSPVKSAEPKLPRDGWVSWQIPAVDAAPDWCCFNWKHGDGSRRSCRLDEKSGGFGNRDDATTDTVKIYARVTGGKLDRVQAL